MKTHTLFVLLLALVAVVLMLPGCSALTGGEEGSRPSVTVNQAPIYLYAPGSSGNPTADASAWSDANEGQREADQNATTDADTSIPNPLDSIR